MTGVRSRVGPTAGAAGSQAAWRGVTGWASGWASPGDVTGVDGVGADPVGCGREVLADVMRCLAEEEWTSRRLCELAQRKQRALVAGAVAELPCIVQAEQVMLAGLSRSETHRARAVRPLVEALGLPSGASIEQLAGELDAESAARIREVGTRISASLSEIGALNEQNARLIEQSLAFVNFSLGVIAKAVGEADTYAATGRRARRGALPRALNREV